MKIPVTKKILREDLKDAPEWAGKIIEAFNSFAEQVYQTLNNNVSFSENILCFVKELSYRTPSGYPTMDDVEFQNDLKIKATGVIPLQVYEKSTYAPPPGPVWVPWVENNGTIVVKSITGLEADKVYLIRLLVS